MVNEPLRPDPDLLLIQADQENRGTLKIFFGACAGVGKTWAMLQEARRLQSQGLDVVAGVVETHGRQETAALLEGLEILPRRASNRPHHQEFDLDAALARQPAVILIDELAHSNLRSCRHPKRWQDIEELLDAGINVLTTVNVQHLESLNDVVSGITGIRVRETVPDRFFDSADEVVLVDLPPDDLRQRLREGKIYVGEGAERAIENFFAKEICLPCASWLCGALPIVLTIRSGPGVTPTDGKRRFGTCVMPFCCVSAAVAAVKNWCGLRPGWPPDWAVSGTPLRLKRPRTIDRVKHAVTRY